MLHRVLENRRPPAVLTIHNLLVASLPSEELRLAHALFCREGALPSLSPPSSPESPDSPPRPLMTSSWNRCIRLKPWCLCTVFIALASLMVPPPLHQLTFPNCMWVLGWVLPVSRVSVRLSFTILLAVCQFPVASQPRCLKPLHGPSSR